VRDARAPGRGRGGVREQGWDDAGVHRRRAVRAGDRDRGARRERRDAGTGKISSERGMAVGGSAREGARDAANDSTDARAREGWTTGSMDGRGARDASTRAARSRWANDRVVLSSIARAREGLGWGGRGARRTDASRARGEALGRGYRRDARARARRTDAFGRGVERRNAKERIRD
jgi:hypothetical protein